MGVAAFIFHFVNQSLVFKFSELIATDPWKWSEEKIVVFYLAANITGIRVSCLGIIILEGEKWNIQACQHLIYV